VFVTKLVENGLVWHYKKYFTSKEYANFENPQDCKEEVVGKIRIKKGSKCSYKKHLCFIKQNYNRVVACIYKLIIN
jgi:hypothetical protein